ncbi:type II CAAX endopeptidase family protein [Paenisporosarcina sp. FSL H8-0542]|uniref:CPBP family intramembrane glutamic endopeptidase n=1 Tax=Paenisporosarcina sp. FSL H8-0542 TaxID=2921401 RepID=UPI00315ACAC5
MKNVIYLFGPTIMIFLGINIFESIPITFGLFYSWLFLIPFVSYFRNPALKSSFYQSIKTEKTLKSIMTGLISGVLCAIAIFGSLSLAMGHLFEIDHVSDILVQWEFSGPIMWLYIFILICINPFLEEWYWREFMYKRYLDKLGTMRSVIITSFFYALYHLLVLIPLVDMPLSVIATIPVLLAGLLWGYFRKIFSSITASVISHTLADIGIILFYIVYLMQ